MIKKIEIPSLKSKYSHLLLSFYDDLQKLSKKKPTKLDMMKDKEKVYNTMIELYNQRFENYYDQYELSDVIKKKNNQKFKPRNLRLEDYDYYRWFTVEELDYKEQLDDMPPLGDEELKKKGLKVLTPNKLFSRLLILLAEIKAGNNSNKLKNDIRQILYLLY